MADESTELLRQLLEVQKEMLAQLQTEAERSAQFRAEAVKQNTVNQKRVSVFSTLMLLIILGGLAYTFLCPWLNH